MVIAQQLIVLLVMLGGGCSDDMSVTARYEPADCPQVLDAGRIIEVQPAPREPEEDPDPGDELVDLNTATQTELETLPGIGPALAKRIIEYREKRRFERTAQLRRVRGIGPATFRKLKEMVCVRPAQNSKP